MCDSSRRRSVRERDKAPSLYALALKERYLGKPAGWFGWKLFQEAFFWLRGVRCEEMLVDCESFRI